jgi:formate hydrogenlyase subunit 6/NADH:ubiquinone oxidoreductase subunit I
LERYFHRQQSLVTGLAITAREFFKPVVTEQYPYEVPTMTPLFRGHIELIGNEETGEPNCVVCGMCQRACPSVCISLDGKKNEGGKGKVLTSYILDLPSAVSAVPALRAATSMHCVFPRNIIWSVSTRTILSWIC